MTEQTKKSTHPDENDTPEALWTFLIERVAKFLPPETKKPDVLSIVSEYKQVIEKAAEATDEFKGCRISPPFSEVCAKWRYENWMPNRGDVLIATYPKTGTTWMTAIVSQLLYKGHEEMFKISTQLSPFFTYLEGALPSMDEIYRQLSLNKRMYATHLLSDCVNIEQLKKRGCKIIYVLRNPKDQILSWYKFRLKLPFYDEGKMLELHPYDWSDFLQAHVAGKQWLYTREGEWYPHHILSWYPYRNEEHIKFVYYEHLKQNPFTSIKEVANFLEIERSDEEIREIVEATSFQSMKQTLKDPDMTRKGIIGDWKNHFTVAQSEMMDQKFEEVMKGTDIRFTYD